jgi:hypothetical protein
MKIFCDECKKEIGYLKLIKYASVYFDYCLCAKCEAKIVKKHNK